jgi:hypothetical protein
MQLASEMRCLIIDREGGHNVMMSSRFPGFVRVSSALQSNQPRQLMTQLSLVDRGRALAPGGGVSAEVPSRELGTVNR